VARTLVRELIGPLPDNLDVVHLDAFLVRLLRRRGHRLNIASSDTQRELIEVAIGSARKRHRSHVLRFSWSFFRDEFEQLIKGKGLSQRDDYLAIARYGRGSPLRRRARLAVWDVYETYQDHLQKRGLLDWQDVTLQAYQELWSQPLSEPYDHVVIDEAQDLTVMQLRAAQRLNKGGAASQERSIFLVGDVAQTLYSRGFRWKEAGLPVVGRSYSIRRNFRNTRQIAEASALLYAYNRRLKLSEDYVDPTFTERQGAWPIVLECDVTDREPRAVYDKILSLVEDQRFRLADFAILSPTRALCDTYRDALKMVQIPCVVYTEKEFDILEERVKILTIHSAKGLEFPIVFLVGLHNGTLPRRIRGWDDEEAAIELERNRNVMYVGMTRAAEALYLVTSKRSPSSFLSEIGKVVRYEPFVGGKA
jgi:superfamily I DNA/RNA helicase